MDRVKNKNYYYNLSQAKLADIEKLDKKPSLLLHSCCGPCNSYVMVMLSEYFDLTLMYNNSNIYPKSEYDIRINELIEYTEAVNKENNLNIKIVELGYDYPKMHKLLSEVNDNKEGGERCQECYKLRMDEAYDYALKHNFDYFTTVMTISRHKNSITLNKIGQQLNEKYSSDIYFFSDFKKKDGLLKSKEIVDEYDMYRQHYCGCAYSYKEFIARENDEK